MKSVANGMYFWRLFNKYFEFRSYDDYTVAVRFHIQHITEANGVVLPVSQWNILIILHTLWVCENVNDPVGFPYGRIFHPINREVNI